jgi:hypothetical protein
MPLKLRKFLEKARNLACDSSIRTSSIAIWTCLFPTGAKVSAVAGECSCSPSCEDSSSFLGSLVRSQVYAPHMQDSTMVGLKHGEVVMNIQVNEQMGDLVSISWVYSRPAHNASDPLYRPNRPVSGATDIPDEFYKEIGALENLKQWSWEVFDKEKVNRTL